ncbi:MAG: MmgE/PrpD family protein, partial [Dehalococcoidia bacterium]
MMDAIERIGRFVETFGFARLPEEALSMAKTAILDTLGAALLGSREESGELVARMAQGEEAKAECTAIGFGFGTSV